MEAANRARVAAIKVERGCADCGYRAHPAALQFDHRPGEVKVANVSALMKRSGAVIATEIAKCDVVCAIHHAIRTWARAKAVAV
jgi:hypothetical protein